MGLQGRGEQWSFTAHRLAALVELCTHKAAPDSAASLAAYSRSSQVSRTSAAPKTAAQMAQNCLQMLAKFRVRPSLCCGCWPGSVPLSAVDAGLVQSGLGAVRQLTALLSALACLLHSVPPTPPQAVPHPCSTARPLPARQLSSTAAGTLLGCTAIPHKHDHSKRHNCALQGLSCQP